MSLPSARRPRTLGGRLLAAQLLVVLVGALTAWLVAAAVGPLVFHDHMQSAGVAAEPAVSAHAEEAFRSASNLSLVMALVAAVIAAQLVSLYTARRITRSAGALAAAARDVAGGQYRARVGPPGLGAEVDEVTEAFNTMAGRLATVEETRRRLLSDLGHELRTPITVLDTYLDAFDDEVTAFEEPARRVLRDQVRRLARLSEDIAAVSRAEEGQLSLHPRPSSPRQLIQAAADAAHARYQAKGVALTTRADAQLPPINVDPDRFGQILSNLLSNALRHTPAGGQVTVSATRRGTSVHIAVIDNGSGIHPEQLPHVFERFYRGDHARDPHHGGSGIGLTVVKALVDAHGGSAHAASAGPGQGATFTVAVPACLHNDKPDG